MPRPGGRVLEGTARARVGRVRDDLQKILTQNGQLPHQLPLSSDELAALRAAFGVVIRLLDQRHDLIGETAKAKKKG